ncbi:MAG: aspartate--tRNA(Asn) ligase, partial [Candidatus Aenigmarchaeota archaeon CG_4_9_14_3_um_filter_37_18]
MVEKFNGWVEEIRNLGGIKFISLHTTDGNRQITLVKKNTPEALFKS